MKTLISLLLVLQLATACASGPSKAELDAEVNRLCAIDGGVKVYETVRLPAEKFNRWGQPIFFDPTRKEAALGPEYIFRRDIHYYQRGNPEMSRTHYVVIRRSDDKLLGETVFYGRGGGDLPSPKHDSSYVCPPYAEADGMSLLKKLFVPQNNKESQK